MRYKKARTRSGFFYSVGHRARGFCPPTGRMEESHEATIMTTIKKNSKGFYKRFSDSIHWGNVLTRKHKRDLMVFALFLLLAVYLWTGVLSDELKGVYQEEISVQVQDRRGEVLEILPNAKGAYMIEGTSTPHFRALAVRSEDRYFFYHPGFNPLSILRALMNYFFYGERSGGSTITQQLVKNLLHNENERTFGNKVSELLYAIALELHAPKERILTMYLNTAYFGSRREGIIEASRYYFGKNAAELSDGEIVRLLALLNTPSSPPGSANNTEHAVRIAKRIGVGDIGVYKALPRTLRESARDPAIFEIHDLLQCTQTCRLTVDRGLTAMIRQIVRDRLSTAQYASVANAAVAVIHVGRGDEPNTLLALIGTPNPYGNSDGSQIDMALLPRPIGSTWKPFIYGKAIERGARPYTLIDDSEYRYEIGTGYAFYPKNYDGIYRGEVTLNYALSNSLNVPAVRTLQFDGIDEFGGFMKEALGFIPKQSFDTYQLSIALGGLEMNPLLLAHYFTVFPRDGVLQSLTLAQGAPIGIPMTERRGGMKRVFAATTTALVTKMLTDRLMGVEQFGLESNLNLPFGAYAVKTGTTYDYHDSWTVGYTPDAVVVVWIGNSNNKAMDLLSGARGAGKIWHDVMTLLVARGDIVPQQFDTRALHSVSTDEGESFGLEGDDIVHARTLMKENNLILEPHDGDVLQYEDGMSVPLRSRQFLRFVVNGNFIGEGTEVFWSPEGIGLYTITAKTNDGGAVTTLRVRVIR